MRTAFFEALLGLAAQDRRLTVVTGDLGFGVIEPFARRFPEQFLNVGVAEQNMTGVAAGLALTGRTVFTYSIANFPTLRCLEQIRNDVCYHGASVKIVAVGGGFSYGSLGMTHHATEDLAILRSLPDMVVVAPGDPVEARHATEAIATQPGPCYLRLGRAGEATVHKEPVRFILGKALQVKAGTDITLISTGGVLTLAVAATEALAARGVNAALLSMHTLKPLDDAAVTAALETTGAVLTIEEHSVVGGLGSAVASVVAQSNLAGAKFSMLGLPDRFCREVGDQDYLRAFCGLTVDGIVQKALALLHERPRKSSRTTRRNP